MAHDVFALLIGIYQSYETRVRLEKAHTSQRALCNGNFVVVVFFLFVST